VSSMTDDHPNMESALAALADDSLPTEDRDRLLAEVHASPELSGALAVQQRAVQLIGSVRVDAPASLHGQVNSMIASRGAVTAARVRVAAVGALGMAVAAVIAILAINLGSSAGPTYRQISALTLARATMPAVAESRVHRSELVASVQGVAFPYWGERFGWRSSGMRVDRVAGRPVTTVFYENPHGRRIGYAILAGGAPKTRGGVVLWRRGVEYRLLSDGGVASVTWQRSGHLCVVSGRDVNKATLLRLASWDDPQSVSS
jgi:hypothetical protein